MIIEPNKIDFSKYKRFFAFGCSFTKWRWPTWVDILHMQMPKVEIYNAGRGGAGNLYIGCQYSLYNNKFKFTDTDLIAVMWTTFYREDRYVNGMWHTPGNMFTQGYYPPEYVEKYADARGYLIRDLGIIDNVTYAMKNAKHDSITLMSVPASYESNDDIEDVLYTYNDLLKQYPKSFYEHQGKWISGHYYYYPGMDKSGPKSLNEPHDRNYEDYHPNTIAHYNYLNYLGFNLKPETEKKCKDIVTTYNSYTHYDQFLKENPPEYL
jgi:hypothetical protein